MDTKFESHPNQPAEWGDFDYYQWTWFKEEYARMMVDDMSESYARNRLVDFLIQNIEEKKETQSELFAEIIRFFGKERLEQVLNQMPTTRQELNDWYPKVSMELMESGNLWEHYRKSRFTPE